MATMKIGDVARRSGISVEAIRYYERLGLIPEAPRTRSGYRRFDEDAIRRLRFVQRAQGLGFALEEIRQLLDLRLDSGATAGDVSERAHRKLTDIEGKIADLERMRDSLRQLTRACCGEGLMSECPILEALEVDGRGAGA